MKINKSEKRLIVVLIALALTLIMVTNIKKITINTIKDNKQTLEEWLSENCDCIEKEKPKCYKGFELENNICVNKTLKIFTSVIYTCSKYNCSDEIYSFNMKKEKWEKVR